MGLDTSHDCWHGAYSAFMRWRCEIARAAGLPPLELMEGFYQKGSPIHDPFWKSKADGLESQSPIMSEKALPIKWECLKPSPLHLLLYHSDCEGELQWKDCGSIADSLEAVLPNLPDEDIGGHIGNWIEKTKTFITGLRLAEKQKENVLFH
jgi:hypothetical protein